MITLEYDKLIIGNNTEAALYSFCHNIPMLTSKEPFVYPFEFFEPNLPFKKLVMDASGYKMKTPTDIKDFGVQKLKVLNRLIFTNSLAGLLPYNEPALDIVVDKTNRSLIIINLRGNVEMKFNELLVFDATNVSFRDLDIVPETKKEKLIVADWFYFDSMKEHDIEYIRTDDDFVRDIFFYISTEGGMVKRKKSKAAVAVSYLEKDELDDCIDVFARIRMQRELSVDTFRKHFAKSSRLKLHFDEREIKYPGSYINTKDNIKFMDLSARQILDNFDAEILKDKKDRLYPHFLLACFSTASARRSVDKWVKERFKYAY